VKGKGVASPSHELAPPVAVWKTLDKIGEGATSVVWRATHSLTRRTVALKVAKGPLEAEAIAREAGVLARVGRRWGPRLVDVGPGFIATEWIEGTPLDPAAACDDRPMLAAVVAHAVGRALDELHEAGVHHGDVKPANVLLAKDRPMRDAATHRGATLIDLGLAAERGGALGGTARYAAPELRERGEGGPAADMWALGVLLAEILDPAGALGMDPGRVRADAGTGREHQPAVWAQVLLGAAPGGRPSAAWIAARAARWLELTTDEEDAADARVERVRRAYLRERSRDLVEGATVGADIGDPARDWLESALEWVAKRVPSAGGGAHAIEPLPPVRRARWLVALVGPSAASWPLAADVRAEGDLAARVVELARIRDPAGWTREDVLGAGDVRAARWSESPDAEPAERMARLVRELARPEVDAGALAAAEDAVQRAAVPRALALQLALALTRAGESGRAWAALVGVDGVEADAARAEIARRRGDVAAARAAGGRAAAGPDGESRWSGQATLARLAWDAGDMNAAERALEGARGPAAAEARALVAWRRGAFDAGARLVEDALLDRVEAEPRARLESVHGLVDMARGDSLAAVAAFGRAVDLATRAGAVVEEATYLTSHAAASADAGDVARSLSSATRAALLWERLGRPERAARAWLARAAALATVGALHATDEAAEEARIRALEAGDREALAYARWAQVEVRAPGDERARGWAIEAAEELRGTSAESELRAAARLLVWAPDASPHAEPSLPDATAAGFSASARWEWWGARAHAWLRNGAAPGVAAPEAILSALLALLDVPAPLAARGFALDAAVRLAKAIGDGDGARRFDLARGAAARALHLGTPPELRSSLAAVSWAHASSSNENPASDVTFAPAQVAQLESIVRALSTRDRLRPLLEQVLDTMVLWTGVERGLLLLRAPDGRLVARAARNLARHDLEGDQLALSQTIARRAIETGDAVVATDALSAWGDVHASVHALRLRSVLAVPLLARGEVLGVVYLDDRVRRGAFGAGELAWVRVVASQAAMAIADARDAVLLRRAVRRAERARERVESMLREREAELHATRTELEFARESRETRYKYDEIAGRSEPMRALLRLVDRVTASEVPLLVVGESGTGKELVARAVHQNGPRARRPFVSENCASVPETLLESTLFGHVRGAFTGASGTRAGLFDVADGGTLFLDEIGEMPLSMQSKLLRVLQDGEVRPVGGERARKVDVRVIGATHRDLPAMVAAGHFREDLFYRLNVVTLNVPALRDRREDIPLLADHFVRKHAGTRPPAKITRAAMARLVAFPWPGNVRQLENEIRRALVLGDGAIDVTELSPDVERGGPAAAREAGLDMKARVDALEAELLVEALGKTRGNQTRAAQLLGLSRFGLQKMMKRLGVKAPE
jgi:serine/threonine-protein kinase PknK